MVKTSIPLTASQINFPGKDPGETFRFYFRRHWIHPMRSWGMMVLWLGIFAALTYGSAPWNISDDITRRVIIVLLSLILIMSQLLFIVKIYHHFLNIVIVTDKKVHQFKRSLIVIDMNHNIDLWLLQDITKRQRGLFQNLFGFGTLNLEVQNSRAKIHFVPHINQVHMQIVGLRELARSATSVGRLQKVQDSPSTSSIETSDDTEDADDSRVLREARTSFA